MAKHVGVKLPEDLVNILKAGKTVGVLATFSEKGLPHTTPIQCIYPKFSKSVIDEIDRVLAQHYGFTDEELDFIINYDIKYRMGRDAGGEEE